jgi:hypothetical protein
MMTPKTISLAPVAGRVAACREIMIALLWLLLMPSWGAAAEARAKLVDYGIFKGASERTIKGDSSGAGGKVELGGSIKLVKKTDRIPAVLGTKFGIKFYLPVELRKNEIVLKYVFLLPGIKDPKTGKIQDRIEVPGKYDGGADGMAYMFYDFTDAWELVPGRWIFQVFHDEDKLLEKTFTVTKAD